MKAPEGLENFLENKFIPYGAAAVLLLAICLLLYSRITYEAVSSKEIPVVRTISLNSDKAESVKIYPGEIRGRHESNLAFQVAGKINARYVNIGDSVKSGQVLMTIDPRDILQTTESADAALDAALSNQKLAADNARRYRELFKQGAVSRSLLDSYETQLDSANAQLRQAQSQANSSHHQLEYTSLVSDADGVVAALSGEIGMVTSAGAVMVTVVQSGEYEVQIYVPENALSYINPDDEVAVTLWALPDLTLQGTITEIAAMADSITRTYRVRVALTNLPESVKLGMTAKVALTGAAYQGQAFIVPASALYQVNGKSQLWLVRNNKATAIDIKVENYLDNQLLISGQDLHSGDIVVTAGLAKLTEQQEVRLESGAAK